MNLISFNSVNANPMANAKRMIDILDSIRSSSRDANRLAVFPELSLSGYGNGDYFLFDDFIDEVNAALEKLLQQDYPFYISLGMPIKILNQLYNCCVLLKGTQIVLVRPKLVLARQGVYYEDRWFSPWCQTWEQENHFMDFLGRSVEVGVQPVVLAECSDLKLAYEICEEAWIASPNSLAKALACDIFLNPSASHFETGKSKKRIELCKRRAEELGAHYVYVNALGNDDGQIIFDGEIIFASKGRDVWRNEDRFNLSGHSLQTITLENGKVISSDPMNPKSLELVDPYFEFCQAATLALMDYWRKSGSRGFAVSLSGGMDSGLCIILIALTVKRLCNELSPAEMKQLLPNMNIGDEETYESLLKRAGICCYQASENSSQKTRILAENLADALHFPFLSVDISEIIAKNTTLVEDLLNEKLDWESHDLALQNIQARCRSPLIWLIANIKNFVLVNTSNRSEAFLGYFTMDGDSSGGIAPLSGVSKHFIQNWFAWAGKNFGSDFPNCGKIRKILVELGSQPPTAELRPEKQHDEWDLMPYSVIDFFEHFYLNKKTPKRDLKKIFQEKFPSHSNQFETFFKRFTKLWRSSQWKRIRLPIGFHLGEISPDPGLNFRYPSL